MAHKETDWRSLVVKADPNWQRDNRHTIEYEFTSHAGGGDERTHENGRRVFKANYDERGPYSDD